MRSYRIYIYITLGFTLFFLGITLLTTPFLVENTMTSLLNNEIAAGKQEANYIGTISGEILSKGITKESALETIQKAITNTEDENIYLSIIDWSGKVVSYPDPTQIGLKNGESSNGIVSMESVISGEDLYNHIVLQNNASTPEIGSDIIFMQPISNSDLIIATHINEDNVIKQLRFYRVLYNTSFSIIGMLTLLFTLGITRYISSKYEELLNQKTVKIEDSVLSLSKLNTSLENYQKNVLELKQSQKLEPPIEKIEASNSNQEKAKQRLLTYVRNELVSTPTEEIAYLYVDNTITYVIRKDGKRSTTNDSLDQIYSSLDEKLFFRANRQIIVAIHAIEKITKFGNSALKIQTNPESEVEIVIGKNKAASFKQWLDI